jgi:hypothetical protein
MPSTTPPCRRVRNPAAPNSELVVTQRQSGGVIIKQGPIYILVGPGETKPLIDAIAEVSA